MIPITILIIINSLAFTKIHSQNKCNNKYIQMRYIIIISSAQSLILKTKFKMLITKMCWTFSLEEMDVIYCNCDFVCRPTNYKYNKNPIRLNPDLAEFKVSDIRIRYPAENQYSPIPNIFTYS